MNVTIFFTRHGQTRDDVPGREKVSGWLPVPLDATGKAQVHSMGRFLRQRDITNILSSDTHRAVQSAEILAEYTGCKITKTDTLRSWNMGSMEGKYAEAMKPFLRFFEENPEIECPGGEPFEDFFKRFKGAFWSLVRFNRKFPGMRIAVVTHSQNLDLIKWLRDGTEPGEAFEFGQGIPPGGVARVTIDDSNKITFAKIFGKGTEKGG